MKFTVSENKTIISDITKVSDEAWRAARRNLGDTPRIGCSETAKILGIYNGAKEPYPWSTPTAFAEELRDAMNGVLKPFETSEAMSWGHIMEAPIAQAWAQQNFMWELVGTHTMYESTRFPWMRGNLDYFVRHKFTHELRILEIKHTSRENRNFIAAMSTGIVPEYYQWQCQAEMTLVNIPNCFICLGWSAMTPGCPVEDIAWVAMDHDQVKEDFMVRASKKFLNIVHTGKEMYVRSDTKAVAAEKKEKRAEFVPGVISFDGSAKSILEEYLALQADEAEASKQAKLLKARKVAVGEQLFALAGQHTKGILATVGLTYEFSLRFTSTKYALETAMAEKEPDLYAECLTLNAAMFKGLCLAKGMSEDEINGFFESKPEPSGFLLRTKDTFKNPISL